jgi:hypothetical protein
MTVTLPITVILVSLVLTIPASGIFVGFSWVEGVVTGPDGLVLEGVRVEVVGLEGQNATTDAQGFYSLTVPYLEVGHTLRFVHPEHSTRNVATGPLEEGVTNVVNVTMNLKPPQATLDIRILPWDQPGSNYGLRQDVMTVVNATGTPFFEWSEKSAEEIVVVPAPGSYLVTATRPGYYPLTLLVSVERGDRKMVDLDMTDRKKPTYGTINGTVDFKGVPVANATIVAEPAEGTRTWEAVTDPLGRFSMQLPNGTYKVRVKAEGFARLSEGVVVELGETEEVHFPLSEAQETGQDENPLWSWVAALVAVGVLGVIVAMALVSGRRSAAARAAREGAKEELACPTCGATASPDADACGECGAAFPWKSFRCPDCGAVLELDATKCPECGNETFDLHRG